MPDLSPVIADLRRLEPRCRAIFLYGSRARGDAGPHSDIDLKLITAGPPVSRVRAHFLEGGDGALWYVSVSCSAYADLVAQAQRPAGWPWVAGLCASARVLDDPADLLGALRAVVALHRLDRAVSADGTHLDLDALIQDVAKCRNARIAGDDAELCAAARLVAADVIALLTPLNAVAPLVGQRQRRDTLLEFAVAPPGYREDLPLCLGDTTQARLPATLLAAAERLAVGTVRLLMERADDIPLDTDLARPLRDGTVLRYLSHDMLTFAERNPELQRQLKQSLEAERRGDMGTPLKELEARRRATRPSERA